MHLLKIMLKASGKKGVPQGGVISPLLSNLYLNEVTRCWSERGKSPATASTSIVEYARFADDLVVLIDAYKRHDWLIGAVTKRLREEFAKLQVEINDEKSRTVDLERGESFGFLGFDFATSAVYAERCGRITRPSSKSGRRFCAGSKRCFADTGRSRLTG